MLGAILAREIASGATSLRQTQWPGTGIQLGRMLLEGLIPKAKGPGERTEAMTPAGNSQPAWHEDMSLEPEHRQGCERLKKAGNRLNS